MFFFSITVQNYVHTLCLCCYFKKWNTHFKGSFTVLTERRSQRSQFSLYVNESVFVLSLKACVRSCKWSTIYIHFTFYEQQDYVRLPWNTCMVCSYDSTLVLLCFVFQCRAESSSKHHAVHQRQNNSLTQFGKVSFILSNIKKSRRLFLGPHSIKQHVSVFTDHACPLLGNILEEFIGHCIFTMKICIWKWDSYY